MRSYNRCFLYLSRGHRANQCSSQRKCRNCGRRHHQALFETSPIQARSETLPIMSNAMPKLPNDLQQEKNLLKASQLQQQEAV